MFLADSQVGGLMKSNFVVVTLIVNESQDKKALENPGGLDLMKRWDGEKAGLPFMVILDPAGKKLADSNERGADDKKLGNIGYPARPNEIAWFLKMLERGSRMSPENRTKIGDWLKEHAPKG